MCAWRLARKSWMPRARHSPTATLRLEFNPERDDLLGEKELRDGLSVVLQIGNTLWVANDESISLERLSVHGGQHKQFSLAEYLRLPVAPTGDPAELEEVDVEGLGYEGGNLWLTGSHALKRRRPRLKKGAKKAQKELAKLRKDGNRYLLARIRVVRSGGSCTLARPAAQLRGNASGNDLTRALRGDKHLGPFLALPGKDNGFDIEGLAVTGRRIFLGLRGPVLGGWAVILELEPVADRAHPATLVLKPIGPKGRLYRKHFLQLGGLGIRDLCRLGRDLLILAGPSMDLDGPVTIFRWKGGARPQGEAMVPTDRLQRLLEVPFGQGEDHAEGMTLFSPDGGKARSILVVYDSASKRRQVGANAVKADVFPLR